ncbi:MAG: hypothetical protein JXL97_14835 [Bacteroidales bacterium]|nr:hypothetical protein [Bacteroidales bacterium]
MKRTINLLLSIFIILSISACKDKTEKNENSKDKNKTENVDKGDKFYSENYKFKVKFPKSPEVEKEEEAMEGFFVQTFMYDGGDNGNMVVAGRMNDMYAELFKGSEEELSVSVRDATIQNLNATLTKDESVDFKGIPSNYYEANGTLDGEEFYLKGINIVKDEFIYVLVVFQKDKDVSDKEYNDFVNSFEFAD